MTNKQLLKKYKLFMLCILFLFILINLAACDSSDYNSNYNNGEEDFVWRTYSNDYFSFEYPGEWELIKEEIDDDGIKVVVGDQNIRSSEGYAVFGHYFRVMFDFNRYVNSLDEFINDMNAWYGVEQKDLSIFKDYNAFYLYSDVFNDYEIKRQRVTYYDPKHNSDQVVEYAGVSDVYNNQLKSKMFDSYYVIPDQYELSIEIIGEGKTSPGEGNHYIDEGSLVEIEVEPYEDFVIWRGENANDVKTSNGKFEILIDENKEIIADFTELEEFEITINKEGAGEVIIDPDKDLFEENTEIKLKAKPNNNYKFYKWSDNISDQRNNEINFNIENDMIINVFFLHEDVPTPGEKLNYDNFSIGRASTSTSFTIATNIQETTVNMGYPIKLNNVEYNNKQLNGEYNITFLYHDPNGRAYTDTHRLEFINGEVEKGIALEWNLRFKTPYMVDVSRDTDDVEIYYGGLD